MSSLTQKPLFTATKGKVVLAFLFAGFALLLAWGVSKFVFGEILGNLQQISAPNDKLRLVNKISHQIASLDQLQRDAEDKNSYFLATQKLRKSLDTLSGLYQTDTMQLKRIKTLKTMLVDRDEQYLAYLKVKSTLLNTQSFSAEIEKLNQLLAQNTRSADSALFTTETSTATTTVAPDEEKSRGFLSRLFGKKKAEVYKIINEEYKVKRDTINPEVQDSVMQSVTGTLKTIADEQQKKSNRFLRKEAELANASGALTAQMLNVLKEVEGEALTQLDRNQLQAKTTVNEGVYQIKVIIIVFFIITFLLGTLILIDISKNNRYRIELEKAKDEAEYHGKAKQRFLSNMSHEIRTPLQSILGYAELVAQQENPDRRHLAAIHQSSNHLLQIVNEVLDYNRIISGEFSFENHDFDLQKTLTDLIETVQPLADKKGIEIVTDFKPLANSWINGDDFRLKQILYNLLGNAIKFTAEGFIKLTAECKQKDNVLHCYFTIEDTGIGFSQTDSDKIFNEFEQSLGTLQQVMNQNGTGLGLAIVKTLVEAQNGRVSVKSKLGEGTTFVVYLKFNKALAQPKLADKVKTSNLVKPKMVWLIDDDRLILELCELVLTQQKIPFKAFSTADAILNEPMDENLSHVLVDMRLEGITGIELHQQLKLRLPESVRFYAMTAQVLPDERAGVLDEGFTGILMKPFKTDDLLAILGVTSSKTETVPFNENVLLKMTMGDEDLMRKILTSFIRDCEDDEKQLNQFIKAADLPNVRLIIHRLAGRTAQIGAKELGAQFRGLEQEVATTTNLNKPLEEKIEQTLHNLNQLLTDVSERVYSSV